MGICFFMVPMSGLEPPTSGLWIPCSHRLSYIGKARILDMVAEVWIEHTTSRLWALRATTALLRGKYSNVLGDYRKNWYLSIHFCISSTRFFGVSFFFHGCDAKYASISRVERASHSWPLSLMKSFWYAFSFPIKERKSSACSPYHPPRSLYISQRSGVPICSADMRLTSPRTIAHVLSFTMLENSPRERKGRCLHFLLFSRGEFLPSIRISVSEISSILRYFSRVSP